MQNFMMSFKFNKQKPQDFGLKCVNGKFVNMQDGTEWEMCELYDFGWGKEHGFYKKPLASFEELIKIVLDSNDVEDSYGAAALIENIYTDELKKYLLNLMHTKIELNKKEKLNNMFHLYKCFNKTLCKGMSIMQIKKECLDWKSIGNFYSK